MQVGARAHLMVGEAEAMLRDVPDGHFDTIITSPPYYALRDYGTATWEGGDPACQHKREWKPRSERSNPGGTHFGQGGKTSTAQDVGQSVFRAICRRCGARRSDDQLGLEATPEEYVDRLVWIFREARRTLADHGTLWLNIGDTWSNDSKWGGDTQRDGSERRRKFTGLKDKDIIGIPWMVAFALRRDGWYLRQEIVWHKPNAIPESVLDRCTKAHESVFLLAKSERYYFDWYAIAEPFADARQGISGQLTSKYSSQGVRGDDPAMEPSADRRNKRDVWSILTEPSPFEHFAAFPPALVDPCVAAGSSEKGDCAECGRPWRRVVERSGGATGESAFTTPALREANVKRGSAQTHNGYRRTHVGWEATCDHTEGPTRPARVLDPFAGTGTTMRVAVDLGREGWGIELSEKHAGMIREHMAQEVLWQHDATA